VLWGYVRRGAGEADAVYEAGV